jgi:hypothetical protein
MTAARNTEGRNLQAKWIKNIRAKGFKTIHTVFMKDKYPPAGFRYLCGYVLTNAPRGININS